MILSMLKTSGLATASLALPALLVASISASIDSAPIDRSIPGISYAPVLENAASSVVGIGTTEFVEERLGGDGPRSQMEEFLRRYYGLPEDEPEEEINDDAPRERRRPTGAGSGVIVSADGYIVTNHHVVTNDMGDLVDEVIVTLSDGREFV
ncbi:MAG: trypsin-like peptidase domain-containing protein, partial [Verrucomicrobiota bacterium]